MEVERMAENDLGWAVDHADADAGARANAMMGDTNFILVVVEDESSGVDKEVIVRRKKLAVKRAMVLHTHHTDFKGGTYFTLPTYFSPAEI